MIPNVLSKITLVIGALVACLAILPTAAQTTITGTPARLAFASAAQSIPLGACAAVSVETLNSAMQPVAGPRATAVSVSGGSGAIGFFSDAACTNKTAQVVIPADRAAAIFYVSGTKEGSFTIGAVASSLGATNQTDTITAPLPPACSSNSAPPTSPPSQAAAAGFNTLVFDDEFNSANTISPNGSGTYNWYTTNFYSASAQLPASGYQVVNNCLTILTDDSGYSAGLSTMGSLSSRAGTFQHGYFEARIQFYPFGSQGSAWPAFWSYAQEAYLGISPFAELDFMEAYPYGSAGTVILTNVHQWTVTSGGKTSVQQPNDVPILPSGFNYDAFHIYGCLWATNSVTWYIDNQPVMTVATGPGTRFTALEQDHMAVILGTGKNWPMTVDYVHIWQ